MNWNVGAFALYLTVLSWLIILVRLPWSTKQKLGWWYDLAMSLMAIGVGVTATNLYIGGWW